MSSFTPPLTRWVEIDAPDPDTVSRLAQAMRLHPLVARVLVQRGLREPEDAQQFLHTSLTSLHDPAQLPGCDDAAQRIAKAVADRQPIVIYGDYDVDGITASSILWHLLKSVDANVRTYVPHRVEEGYGLNSDALQAFAEESPSPLVVSVDCGITGVAEAAHARDHGLELIITDHHELEPDNLPPAAVLVHPRLPGSTYPFGQLCGAGVAFKLAWQIARALAGSDRVSDAHRELLVELLSLAALGTVADVMPLVGENRTIVRHGLSRIKHTRFEGLAALIDASRLQSERIDAYHVGFVLGPRLNACGRMGHARDAVRLLTTAAGDEAVGLAQFLTRENDRRRQVEKRIFEQAVEVIEDRGYHQPDARAIVLSGEGWHQGVIGIVASRLVDRYHRPVVLLTTDNGRAKGSARSIEGFHLYDALQQAEHLMESFGGHAMAAGLTLPTDHIDTLRQLLLDHAGRHLTDDRLAPTLKIDARCTLEQLDGDLFHQLPQLAPFGRGNPSPVFGVTRLQVDRPPLRLGTGGRHLKLWLKQGRCARQAIGFGMGEAIDAFPTGRWVDAAFEPKLSTWRGRTQAELHLKDLRPAVVEPQAAPTPSASDPAHHPTSP